jgi:hypothetical protein
MFSISSNVIITIPGQNERGESEDSPLLPYYGELERYSSYHLTLSRSIQVLTDMLRLLFRWICFLVAIHSLNLQVLTECSFYWLAIGCSPSWKISLPLYIKNSIGHPQVGSFTPFLQVIHTSGCIRPVSTTFFWRPLSSLLVCDVSPAAILRAFLYLPTPQMPTQAAARHGGRRNAEVALGHGHFQSECFRHKNSCVVRCQCTFLKMSLSRQQQSSTNPIPND